MQIANDHKEDLEEIVDAHPRMKEEMEQHDRDWDNFERKHRQSVSF